jgi:hypothetical protein
VDWERLERLPPTRLTAQVVAVQLQLCHLLTGAQIPAALQSRSVRLQALRQRLQYSVPALRAPLALLAILGEGPRLAQHRRSVRQGQPYVGLPPQAVDLSLSLGRLAEILRSDLGGRL